VRIGSQEQVRVRLAETARIFERMQKF